MMYIANIIKKKWRAPQAQKMQYEYHYVQKKQ